MAGIENSGFRVKNFNELKTEIENSFKGILGNDINISSTSILGNMIDIIANNYSNLWELSQSVYNSRFIETASGDSLERITRLFNLDRIAGVRTSGIAYLIGETGTVIPQGTQFRSSAGAVYETLEDLTLGDGVAPILKLKREDGSTKNEFTLVPENSLFNQFIIPDNPLTFNYSDTESSIKNTFEEYFRGQIVRPTGVDSTIGSVTRNVDDNNSITINFNENIFLPKFESEELQIDVLRAGLKDGVAGDVANVVEGAIETDAGQLNEIATPIDGLTGVVNFLSFNPGRLRETDNQLRNRFIRRVSSSLTSSKDSIERELSSLNGVTQSIIFEGSLDNENLKPGQIEVLVLGGEAENIAQVIFDNKPVGVQLIGNINSSAVDTNGNPHVVLFSRPEVIRLDVRVNIKRNNLFPIDGVDTIKRILFASQSEFRLNSTLSPSPDLIFPLNNVPGIVSLEVLLSNEGADNFSEDTLNLTNKQIPSFSNIRVYEEGVEI